jgi:hypothetical protein
MRVGLLARRDTLHEPITWKYSLSLVTFQFAILKAPPLFLGRFRRRKNVVVHYALTGNMFEFLLTKCSFFVFHVL